MDYKSVFLDLEWGYEKYFGWSLIESASEYVVYAKSFGFLKRYLVLSQLGGDEISNKLSRLELPTALSVLTVKEFSTFEDGTDPLKVGALRINRVSENERIFNRHTFVIDLNLSEESLYQNLTSDYRRKIRKARDSGAEVEISTNVSHEYLAGFLNRYVGMANDRGLYTPKLVILQNMANDGNLFMCTVSVGCELISQVLIFKVGDKAIFLYGVGSKKNNDGSGQFLHWEIIKFLKSIGISCYDLGGVPNLNIENGIYRFKKGFGGELVNLGVEYYYCPSWVRLAKNIYHSFRSVI